MSTKRTTTESRAITVVQHFAPVGIEGLTFRDLSCGCSVSGNGTLPYPLTVRPCKSHAKKARKP